MQFAKRHVENVNGLEYDFGRFFGSESDSEYAFYKRAIDRAADLDTKRLSLEAAGKLTKSGIKDELSTLFVKLAERHDNDSREVERLLAEAHERASRIALSGVEKIDPGDAVTALADQELRQFWQGLDHDRKSELHTAMLQGKHPALAHALLRGNELITGLIPERRALLQDALLPAEKRQQMEYVQSHVKRLEGAKRALQAGYHAMQARAGLLPSEARKARGLPSMVEEVMAEHGLTGEASSQDAAHDGNDWQQVAPGDTFDDQKEQ